MKCIIINDQFDDKVGIISNNDEAFRLGDAIELTNHRGYKKKGYLAAVRDIDIVIMELDYIKERSYTYEELDSIKHIKIDQEENYND